MSRRDRIILIAIFVLPTVTATLLFYRGINGMVAAALEIVGGFGVAYGTGSFRG